MIGEKLLHYEILEKLGEGGMGVVYKARDTHLDRLVALKVLPPEKVADPSRKARFVQEAKAASALNHANIVTIYDIASDHDTDFIAMEYVAGQTLDQVIPRRGMRLNGALKIALQIAGALARAHAAGIVHRDLKPSNVILDDHGSVKLLDFGLAKLVEAATSDDTTANMGVKTEEGTVVGTAAYMSPEQALGHAIDARSDIFSFGAVLYEMLAGHHAFQGTSKISVLTAVLHEEPAPLPADVPYELRRLIERCLRKDPERRLRSMDDVKLALEDLKQESDSGKLSGPGETASPAKRRRTYGWAGMAAVVVLVMLGGLWRYSRPDHSQQAVREIPFVTEPGDEQYPVFSPDGTTVAFSSYPEAERWGVETPDGTIQLKMIGTDAIQVLKKNDAWSPAWSTDGRWLAYLTGSTASASICVMPRIGGVERKIATVKFHVSGDRLVSWTQDGKWLASWDKEGAKPFHLVLVSLETGEKVRLTNPPEGSWGDTGPMISPDGRTLAFTRHSVRGRSDIHLLTLDANLKPTGEPRPLKTGVPNANYAVWTPDGKEIVFCSRVWHAATLWRMRSDGSGKATPLTFGGRGAFAPDIARVGNRLVYMKHVWDTNIWRVELDPAGRAARTPERFIASSMTDAHGSWSPDGKWIAFNSERLGTREIWVCEASGANPRQITSLDSTGGMNPVWSSDGQWIAFEANVEGNLEIYVIRASGGKHRRLTSDPANDNNPRWSADGKWITFRSNRGGQSLVWKVAPEGGEAIAADQETLGSYGPGGDHVYYVVKGSLWRKPASGGAEERILSGMRGTSFAVSAQGVYFTFGTRDSQQAPWKNEVAFHDFATGQRTKIADLRPGTFSGTGYSVSPDGRYLLYTQADREGADLMLVENFR